MPRNRIKDCIAQGRRARGIHLTFAEPTVIEVLAHEGLDFVYIDGEHGAIDSRDVERLCVAAELNGLTAIARVPDRSVAAITRFLDRGVMGIVVPHVDGVAHAREVIDAAFYAPAGNRSFGGGRPGFVHGIADKPAFMAQCNAALSLCIMIESAGALAAAGEIAALPEVDYLSFGMMDLAQALGHPGDPAHPAVQAAVAAASERIRAAGKPVREDFMTYAWINDIMVAGARGLLGVPAASAAAG